MHNINIYVRINVIDICILQPYARIAIGSANALLRIRIRADRSASYS
jgi:hypothetical protein